MRSARPPAPARWLAWLMVVALTGCGLLPIPRLVFDTPTPPATDGPPPTPLPAEIVTFKVRVPPGTPANSAPAVKVIDEVGGTTTTVILTNTGNNEWTGATQAAVGSAIRYRYFRPLPVSVDEVTAAQEPVSYRLFAVTAGSPTVEDIVAGWTDLPFAGEVGGLEGRVWNGTTGQGVSGMLVSAGGQLTLSGHDGGFMFDRLPVGAQRATLLAPDGSLRPAQASATVSRGSFAPVDIISVDPNAVHITFLVRPPAGTDASAVLRLTGNVDQLGDTFALSANGSAIAPALQPSLVPLADGRWTVRLQFYEGTVLRYKYTLGDGVWNAELNSAGDARLRELIVPPVDILVDDTIVTWRRPGATTITFEALTPPSTPSTDLVTLQFRTGAWQPPLPMWRMGANDWRFVLYNPSDFSGNTFYRYCRNYACGRGDDASTMGPGAAGRIVTTALFGQYLRDSIAAWQWLDGSSSFPGVLPAVSARPGFWAGFDVADDWDPNAIPSYALAFDSMRADGAGWVNFTARQRARHMLPAPLFSRDLALAPHPDYWREIVATAHNVGLRVSLHPVTCHHTPYGACEYWNGVDFSGGFWDAWFAAYERAILAQAAVARDTGTDQLVIGDFKLRPSFPGEPEAPPDAEARWRTLIDHIRGVYGGPLAFELLLGDSIWPNPPPFLDRVDAVRVWWWSPLSTSNRPAIADMTVAAAALLDNHVQPLQQRFGKPVHLVLAYESVDGAATQCLRRPDGQCHSFEDFAPGAPDVAQYPVDLPEQADIYQSILAAVNDRPWVGGLSSYGYDPQVILRDKWLSVRGKPAESVLGAWYPKLTGR
jgi:hypothetical protein